jgi:hypothetical protein
LLKETWNLSDGTVQIIAGTISAHARNCSPFCALLSERAFAQRRLDLAVPKAEPTSLRILAPIEGTVRSCALTLIMDTHFAQLALYVPIAIGAHMPHPAEASTLPGLLEFKVSLPV